MTVDAPPNLGSPGPVRPPGTAAAPVTSEPRRGWRRSQGRTPPRRIALFGRFGCGHPGNDGALEAMLTFLRRILPRVDLTCISTAPDKVARQHGLMPIPLGAGRPTNGVLRSLDWLLLGGPHQLASLVRALRHARHLDVLIIPGTDILDDFGEGPSGMPVALFGWCLAARLCGTRIAFVSIGAGPIHHPLSRWLIKSAAAMAHYRSYRDTVSAAYMQSIGFDTRDDAVYPDLAFKLPTPPVPSRRVADGPLTVAVGVMGYHGWRQGGSRGRGVYAIYIGKIRQFVLWLLDQDCRVRFLMGDEVDWQAVADVVTRVATARPDLPDDRLRTEPLGSLNDLMRQMTDADVVVATRYHNVICGLKLGKPTISISYAQKNDVLLAEMGLGPFCQSLEHLDVDLLKAQFIELIAKRFSYERTIRQILIMYRNKLAEQDAILASRFFLITAETLTTPRQKLRG